MIFMIMIMIWKVFRVSVEIRSIMAALKYIYIILEFLGNSKTEFPKNRKIRELRNR